MMSLIVLADTAYVLSFPLTLIFLLLCCQTNPFCIYLSSILHLPANTLTKQVSTSGIRGLFPNISQGDDLFNEFLNP